METQSDITQRMRDLATQPSTPFSLGVKEPSSRRGRKRSRTNGMEDEKKTKQGPLNQQDRCTYELSEAEAVCTGAAQTAPDGVLELEEWAHALFLTQKLFPVNANWFSTRESQWGSKLLLRVDYIPSTWPIVNELRSIFGHSFSQNVMSRSFFKFYLIFSFLFYNYIDTYSLSLPYTSFVHKLWFSVLWDPNVYQRLGIHLYMFLMPFLRLFSLWLFVLAYSYV